MVISWQKTLNLNNTFLRNIFTLFICRLRPADFFVRFRVFLSKVEIYRVRQKTDMTSSTFFRCQFPIFVVQIGMIRIFTIDKVNMAKPIAPFRQFSFNKFQKFINSKVEWVHLIY